MLQSSYGYACYRSHRKAVQGQDKQFEAIQFRNQGYTNREIAELCGVGRKAIEKRFARIRKILSDYKEN